MASPQIIEVVKSKEAKKRFEFLLNERAVANVDYPKRYEKTATITSDNQKWLIKRKGWWKHSIEISSDQSPYSKWSLLQNWKGHTSIRTDDNRQFFLKKRGFWKQTWFWLNEKEESVVEIQPCGGWPKRKKGTITIHNPSDKVSNFLALIGWFVAQAAQEDAAAGAATVVAVPVS